MVYIKDNNKSYILLYMYSVLKDGQIINKDDLIDRFSINERTFYRYIKEIRNFIYEEGVNTNIDLIDEDIIFDKEKDGYILSKREKSNLNEKEILAVSKVLLESRGLIKEELEIILQKILKNCNKDEKENIKSIIGNELVNYVEPQHGRPLIESLWTISSCIKKQQAIEIEYRRSGENISCENNISKRTIYPQGIMFSEYYFYMMGIIKGKNFEHPTIFRVDRIENLKVLDEKFTIDYSKRFQEGEFRKNIHYMQTGYIERVKFKFTGVSIEAVKDRLPNARVIKNELGEYIVDTHMFEKGLKMWLLSQGEFVEVLRPQSLIDDMKKSIEIMNSKY